MCVGCYSEARIPRRGLSHDSSGVMWYYVVVRLTAHVRLRWSMSFGTMFFS